ncbi:MAG: mechanosensitive ion channel domain-containing protein [Candidatus Zixiibacteriota bacterium]
MRILKITSFILLLTLACLAQQVKIGEDNLFILEVPSNELSAVERARHANTILDSLTFKTSIDSTDVFIKAQGDNYNIRTRTDKGRVILSVMPADTLGTGMKQIDVALNWLSEIRHGIIQQRRNSKGFSNILRFVLLLLSPILILIIYLILNSISKKMSKVVMEQEGKAFKGVKFGKIQLLTPVRETKILLRLISIIKYIIFALIFYFSLLTVLSQFSQTEHYVMILKEKMEGAYDIASNFFASSAEVLIGVLILFLVMKLLLALLNLMGSKYANIPSFTGNLTPGGYQAMINTIKKFVIILFFLGVIYIIPGGDTLAFVLLVIIVLVIGLAFVSIIRDFIAGYILMLRGIYQEGDTITAVDFKGKVVNRSFLFTELEMENKSKLILHNGLILSKPIIVHEIKDLISEVEETEGNEVENDAKED